AAGPSGAWPAASRPARRPGARPATARSRPRWWRRRSMVEVRVPAVGESISEVEIGDWLKRPGDPVRLDEPLVVLETEKASLELPAPAAGVLAAVRKQKGEHARVGEVIAELAPGPVPTPAASAAGPAAARAVGVPGGAGSAPPATAPGPAAPVAAPPSARDAPSAPAARPDHPAPPSPPVAPPDGPRPDVARVAPAEPPSAEPPPPAAAAPARPAPSPDGHERVERAVRMSPIRRRI